MKKSYSGYAETVELCRMCKTFHADVREVTTLLELLGGLSPEQSERVLYQASIAAAAEKISVDRRV